MRAALFDFDGVLVHSTPIHLQGWDEAYRQLFKSNLDPATMNSLVGRSTAGIGSFLANLAGNAAAKPELIRRKVDFVFAHLPHIPLIEGASEFIQALIDRGLPFGVVSNAPRKFIAAALARHQLPVPFFLGLEDYHRPKPDAEPYMKGAARLGFRFQDHAAIYVFEDSTHGIQAALAAQMTAIGICSQHPAELLIDAGAQRCFKDLNEALALLA